MHHFIPHLVLNSQMPRLMLAIGVVTREDRGVGGGLLSLQPHHTQPLAEKTSVLRKGREMNQGRKEDAADPKAKAQISPCGLDAKGWGIF